MASGVCTHTYTCTHILSQTKVATWRVSGLDFLLSSLTDGDLPGHNAIGSNILVDSRGVWIIR